MNKGSLKFASYLFITVLLTLGLTVSLQSLLAAWTAPTAGPPADNVNPPIFNEHSTPATNALINKPLSVGGNLTMGGNIVMDGNWLSGDGGNEGVYVDDLGNVGIGIASPAAKLDVYGGNTIVDNYFYIRDYDDGTISNPTRIISRDGNFQFWNGGVIVGRYGDGVLGDLGNGNLVVQGNVGIGTAGPDELLEVYQDSGNASIKIGSGNNDYETILTNYRQWVDGSPMMTLTGKNGDVIIGQYRSGTSKVTALLSGNVGIGTAGPGYKLEIMPSNPVKFGFTSTGTSYPRLYMGGDSASVAYVINRINTGATAYFGENTDAGGYQFRGTGDMNLGSGRVMIKNNGNVGIGTASLSEKLHVAGTVVADEFKTDGDNLRLSGSGWGVEILLDTDGGSADSFVIKDTGVEKFRVDGNTGNVGIGTTIPGEKLEVFGNVLADAFLYSSDRNLKKDIQKIDNALEKIQQLEGVSFKWKKNSQPNLGLIAQDLEKVFPELVSTNENTGLKSVQYGNLVAPLIEAIKEQQEQINELAAEVEKLKNEAK